MNESAKDGSSDKGRERVAVDGFEITSSLPVVSDSSWYLIRGGGWVKGGRKRERRGGGKMDRGDCDALERNEQRVVHDVGPFKKTHVALQISKQKRARLAAPRERNLMGQGA